MDDKLENSKQRLQSAVNALRAIFDQKIEQVKHKAYQEAEGRIVALEENNAKLQKQVAHLKSKIQQMEDAKSNKNQRDFDFLGESKIEKVELSLNELKELIKEDVKNSKSEF